MNDFLGGVGPARCDGDGAAAGKQGHSLEATAPRPNPVRAARPGGPGLQRDRSEAQAYGNGGEQPGTAPTTALASVPPLQGKWPVRAQLMTVMRSRRLGNRCRDAASWSRRRPRVHACSQPSQQRDLRLRAPYMATDPATGGIICWQRFGPNMAEGP